MLSLDQEVFKEQEDHPEQMEELRKGYPLDQVDRHWFCKGRPVVPDKQELQRSILQQYHDHNLAGHPVLRFISFSA